MKKPTVFSLAREQSVFMTVIMGLMTFLGVMALGIAIAIGGAVVRWNSQWTQMATIQVTKNANALNVEKVLTENKTQIESLREIPVAEMEKLMKPWMSDNGGVLQNYLPRMWEVKFASPSAMRKVADKIAPYGRFLTHADAVKTSINAGWLMIFIAGIILAMAIGAITMCVSYIARNTAKLHRRELEILNQVGATDSFIARQMQFIVGKICVFAAIVGFVLAAIVLMLVVAAARSARVGLMAMMGISGGGWLMLGIATIIMVIFAIWMTKRTTLKILKNN